LVNRGDAGHRDFSQKQTKDAKRMAVKERKERKMERILQEKTEGT